MAYRTILLKGDGVYKEAAAGGAITPGHLITYETDGEVAVHAGAALNAFPMFALENDVVGKGIADAYATGDRCYFVVPQRGAEVAALVKHGEPAIVIGDLLESNGDGTLTKTTAPTVAIGNVRHIVARALEAVDNSGGSVPVRIKVEIL